MIADLPILHTPPAIVAPEAIERVRKRRRDRGDSNDNSNTATPRATIPAWLYVGAIVMMTGDDGESIPLPDHPY